jgi:hypothetical protein
MSPISRNENAAVLRDFNHPPAATEYNLPR